MMPSLVQLTDALAVDLVSVPRDSDDVCPMCRSWRAPGFDRCNNCEQAMNDLTAVCEFVVPISLYRKPSEMRDRMTNYKNGSEDEQRRYAPEVASILDRYFAEFGDRLQARTGGWDVACVVPSESRVPPHPLESAMSGLPATHVPVREALLERHIGNLGHRVLSDDAFRTTKNVAGKRILLLDDVLTTGARSQSAASTLTIAGAQVAAVVVIGRRVNVEWNTGVQVLWDRQTLAPFTFTDPPWWA
jgi:predicted amidophosphoribosyltransferase